MPRYYTLSEANAMLTPLTRLLNSMQQQAAQLAAIQRRKEQVKEKIRGNGHRNPAEDQLVADLESQAESEIESLVSRLSDWGIELKDLSDGLVDFPAQREGRTVYLCWKLGEPEIAFWHELTTGFTGRQPVDDLTA